LILRDGGGAAKDAKASKTADSSAFNSKCNCQYERKPGIVNNRTERQILRELQLLGVVPEEYAGVFIEDDALFCRLQADLLTLLQN
jgi:hypothetical protein